jgi:hypothetical protein
MRKECSFRASDLFPVGNAAIYRGVATESLIQEHLENSGGNIWPMLAGLRVVLLLACGGCIKIAWRPIAGAGQQPDRFGMLSTRARTMRRG